MANNLSINEIVELGIQIEINGRDFYNGIASKEDDKETKEVFAYLTGEEEKHIETFNSMLERIHKYEPREAYPQEYFAYMNSLASEVIFTKKNKGAEIAEKVKDGREAIDLGIGFEKDSVEFYQGVKQGVSGKDKDIVEQLIEEEKKHIETLLELRKEFTGDNNG